MQMILPKAILFDMDGTLTHENLDYDRIRAEIGLGQNEPILEAVLAMHGDERARAEEILHRHEYIAASEAELCHGCKDLLHWMDTKQMGRALITRNTRKSVETILQTHDLRFDITITREDGKFKPDPAPLFMACERLGVSPQDVWMVGDWKFDVEAANNGNIKSIWLSHGRVRPFDAVPTVTVENLLELTTLLQGMASHR